MNFEIGSTRSLRSLRTLRRAHKITRGLEIARAGLPSTSDMHIVEGKVRAATIAAQDVVVLRIRGRDSGDVLQSLRGRISVLLVSRYLMDSV